MNAVENIVLFDGDCKFCNASVNFILKNNSANDIYFSPLNSPKAQELKKKYSISNNIDSLIFIKNNKAFTYSDATLEIAAFLKTPYKYFSWLKAVPTFIRNPIYKWIAKNRINWFGKNNQCLLFDSQTMERFL